MSQFKVGIIGLGMIGASMLAEFDQHPSFEVTSVWDLNPEINAGISRQFPHIPIADDAGAMIADPAIHLIYIATPPRTHVDYGLKVIAAGKALLCDKPLAIDLEQGQLLRDKAAEAGIPTAMNFVYGAGGIVDAFEQQLEADVLGLVKSVEIRYQFPSWPLPNQLSAAAWITKRHEGGMLREMLSHFIYLLQRLFGDVTVQAATIEYPEDDTQAELFAIARLAAGGIPVWLMGGIGGPHAPRESELTLHGSQASLRLSSLSSLSLSQNGAWQPLPQATTAPSDATARLDELAKRLGGEPSKLPTLSEGLAVQDVVERLLEVGSQ